MNTLIINGSPHIKGDTALLVDRLSKKLVGKVEILNIWEMNFQPCINCDKCKTQSTCVFEDSVSATINSIEEYDNIVLATPLYYNQPTGVMLNFLSRLQLCFNSKEIQKSKRAGIIVVGGGDCVVNSSDAEKTLRIALRSINAKVEAYARCLHTSETPANRDENALAEIDSMAEKLNL